ncbi:MAG TPA: BamA/TamA family outer membrane protein [Steroidobacteraceae bacterium]|nr:BamA/TamA family outer membrane protein [Steroidobacteraceae bacterium]
MPLISNRLRGLTLILLGAVGAYPAMAAKITDKERTQIREPRPADVPTDADLEAAGAVIGRIEIEPDEIFDKNDPRENNGLYLLADRLHIRTKRATIRAQLLFKTGDRYVAERLAETERNLRLQPYFYDAHVVPVHFAGGKVDVRVITRDVWTLDPSVSLGRAGGRNSTSYSLQEENFLGWGKSVEIGHTRNVDRTSNLAEYSDPNLFGSRWTGSLAYVDSSDGDQRAVQFAQPFYALETPWSATVLARSYDRTNSRYFLGNIVDQYNDNETTYQLGGGISSGLVQGWTRRLLFGVYYDRNQFLPTPQSLYPSRQIPADRTLSYPFVGFDILQDDYAKIGDENQIGRTEDLYLGTEITSEIGYSSDALGANRDAVMLTATARSGYDWPYDQQLFVNGSVSGRLESGRIRNLIANGAARYYWRWRPDWLLFASLSGTVTDALDPDVQVLLGGDSGLRGYPLRYEAGTSRSLFTLEQRVFTDWYPFRLVRVGAAAFVDVGRTWGSGVVGNSDLGLLSDAGIGLRLGNARSGLGNVLHIDFAFPLKNVPNNSRFQLLVQTMQSF